MKIKLTENLPIEPRHKCFKNKEYEVTKQLPDRGRGQNGQVAIIAESGETVIVLDYEYEIVKNEH